MLKKLLMTTTISALAIHNAMAGNSSKGARGGKGIGLEGKEVAVSKDGTTPVVATSTSRTVSDNVGSDANSQTERTLGVVDTSFGGVTEVPADVFVGITYAEHSVKSGDSPQSEVVVDGGLSGVTEVPSDDLVGITHTEHSVKSGGSPRIERAFDINGIIEVPSDDLVGITHTEHSVKSGGSPRIGMGVEVHDVHVSADDIGTAFGIDVVHTGGIPSVRFGGHSHRPQGIVEKFKGRTFENGTKLRKAIEDETGGAPVTDETFAEIKKSVIITVRDVDDFFGVTIPESFDTEINRADFSQAEDNKLVQEMQKLSKISVPVREQDIPLAVANRVKIKGKTRDEIVFRVRALQKSALQETEEPTQEYIPIYDGEIEIPVRHGNQYDVKAASLLDASSRNSSHDNEVEEAPDWWINEQRQSAGVDTNGTQDVVVTPEGQKYLKELEDEAKLLINAAIPKTPERVVALHTTYESPSLIENTYSSPKTPERVVAPHTTYESPFTGQSRSRVVEKTPQLEKIFDVIGGDEARQFIREKIVSNRDVLVSNDEIIFEIAEEIYGDLGKNDEVSKVVSNVLSGLQDYNAGLTRLYKKILDVVVEEMNADQEKIQGVAVLPYENVSQGYSDAFHSDNSEVGSVVSRGYNDGSENEDGVGSLNDVFAAAERDGMLVAFVEDVLEEVEEDPDIHVGKDIDEPYYKHVAAINPEVVEEGADNLDGNDLVFALPVAAAAQRAEVAMVGAVPGGMIVDAGVAVPYAMHVQGGRNVVAGMVEQAAEVGGAHGAVPEAGAMIVGAEVGGENDVFAILDVAPEGHEEAGVAMVAEAGGVRIDRIGIAGEAAAEVGGAAQAVEYVINPADPALLAAQVVEAPADDMVDAGPEGVAGHVGDNNVALAYVADELEIVAEGEGVIFAADVLRLEDAPHVRGNDVEGGENIAGEVQQVVAVDVANGNVIADLAVDVLDARHHGLVVADVAEEDLFAEWDEEDRVVVVPHVPVVVMREHPVAGEVVPAEAAAYVVEAPGVVEVAVDPAAEEVQGDVIVHGAAIQHVQQIFAEDLNNFDEGAQAVEYVINPGHVGRDVAVHEVDQIVGHEPDAYEEEVVGDLRHIFDFVAEDDVHAGVEAVHEAAPHGALVGMVAEEPVIGEGEVGAMVEPAAEVVVPDVEHIAGVVGDADVAEALALGDVVAAEMVDELVVIEEGVALDAVPLPPVAAAVVQVEDPFAGLFDEDGNVRGDVPNVMRPAVVAEAPRGEAGAGAIEPAEAVHEAVLHGAPVGMVAEVAAEPVVGEGEGGAVVELAAEVVVPGIVDAMPLVVPEPLEAHAAVAVDHVVHPAVEGVGLEMREAVGGVVNVAADIHIGPVEQAVADHFALEEAVVPIENRVLADALPEVIRNRLEGRNRERIQRGAGIHVVAPMVEAAPENHVGVVGEVVDHADVRIVGAGIGGDVGPDAGIGPEDEDVDLFAAWDAEGALRVVPDVVAAPEVVEHIVEVVARDAIPLHPVAGEVVPAEAAAYVVEAPGVVEVAVGPAAEEVQGDVIVHGAAIQHVQQIFAEDLNNFDEGAQAVEYVINPGHVGRDVVVHEVDQIVGHEPDADEEEVVGDLRRIFDFAAEDDVPAGVEAVHAAAGVDDVHLDVVIEAMHEAGAPVGMEAEAAAPVVGEGEGGAMVEPAAEVVVPDVEHIAGVVGDADVAEALALGDVVAAEMVDELVVIEEGVALDAVPLPPVAAAVVQVEAGERVVEAHGVVEAVHEVAPHGAPVGMEAEVAIIALHPEAVIEAVEDRGVEIVDEVVPAEAGEQEALQNIAHPEDLIGDKEDVYAADLFAKDFEDFEVDAQVVKYTPTDKTTYRNDFVTNVENPSYKEKNKKANKSDKIVALADAAVNKIAQDAEDRPNIIASHDHIDRGVKTNYAALQHFVNHAVANSRAVESRIGNFYSTMQPIHISPASSTMPSVGTQETASPAAGDEDVMKFGLWASGVISQGKRSGDALSRYKVKQSGYVFGGDTLLHETHLIGAAYSNSKLISKSSGGTRETITGDIFSLYGTYVLDDKLHISGQVQYGTIKLRGIRNTGDVNQDFAFSNTKGKTFGGKVVAGYNKFLENGSVFVPKIGMAYNQTKIKAFSETGNGQKLTYAEPIFGNKFSAIVGAEVSKNYSRGDFSVTPSLYATYEKVLSQKNKKINIIVDAGKIDDFSPISAEKENYNFNFGAKLNFLNSKGLEVGIGYDQQRGKEYVAHTGTLKVRVSF